MPTKKPAHGPAAAGGDADDQKPRPRLEPDTWGALTRHCLNDDRLKARELRVLHCISCHADAGGYAWPSQDLIAEETSLHRVTVTLAIKQLLKLGYLVLVSSKRRRGRWASNSYRVVRLKRTLEPP